MFKQFFSKDFQGSFSETLTDKEFTKFIVDSELFWTYILKMEKINGNYYYSGRKISKEDAKLILRSAKHCANNDKSISCFEFTKEIRRANDFYSINSSVKFVDMLSHEAVERIVFYMPKNTLAELCDKDTHNEAFMRIYNFFCI